MRASQSGAAAVGVAHDKKPIDASLRKDRRPIDPSLRKDKRSHALGVIKS